MIVSKLAARLGRARRLASLSLLSGSLGGVAMVPPLTARLLQTLPKLATARTPERRADADLNCHFTDAFLDEEVPAAEVAEAEAAEAETSPAKPAGAAPTHPPAALAAAAP